MNRHTAISLAGFMCGLACSTASAADLDEAVIVGVERSIFVEPPSDPLDEASSTDAHTINCTMRLGATIGYATTPNTGDLDDVAFYAHAQCGKPSVSGAAGVGTSGIGGVAGVGKTGVKKWIKHLDICESVSGSSLFSFCIPATVLPAATTADAIFASAEYDTDFLDTSKRYNVVALVYVQNPNTDWTSAVAGLSGGSRNYGDGQGSRPANVCRNDPLSTLGPGTYECLLMSPSFRYMP